jgi:hypothetical protein
VALFLCTASTSIAGEIGEFDKTEVRESCSILSSDDAAQTESCILSNRLAHTALLNLTVKAKSNRILTEAFEQCAYDWEGYWPFVLECADKQVLSAVEFIDLASSIPINKRYDAINYCSGQSVYVDRHLNCLKNAIRLYKADWDAEEIQKGD